MKQIFYGERRRARAEWFGYLSFPTDSQPFLWFMLFVSRLFLYGAFFGTYSTVLGVDRETNMSSSCFCALIVCCLFRLCNFKAQYHRLYFNCCRISTNQFVLWFFFAENWMRKIFLTWNIGGARYTPRGTPSLQKKNLLHKLEMQVVNFCLQKLFRNKFVNAILIFCNSLQFAGEIIYFVFFPLLRLSSC